MIQKQIFFSKNLIQVLFLNEFFFCATTFPRMHKTAYIDVFTVYFDQLYCSLRASFPKNLDFLTTLFWPKTDALQTSWLKFWRYVEINSNFDTKFFIFFYKKPEAFQKLVNISDQNLTCSKKMFQNLTCCKNSDSKNDELFKVDQKSDIFSRTLIQSRTRCKNLFQKLILLKILHSKTVYYPYFSLNHGFWESR